MSAKTCLIAQLWEEQCDDTSAESFKFSECSRAYPGSLQQLSEAEGIILFHRGITILAQGCKTRKREEVISVTELEFKLKYSTSWS